MAGFIIDCPRCKAKVGAEGGMSIDRSYFDDDAGEPYGERVMMGKCPTCTLILVGRAEQRTFANYQGDDQDTFGDVVRVYPEPPKVFTSYRIPRPLTQSLIEADRSLQAGANIAATVMLGRALEALCRDNLEDKTAKVPDQPEPKRKRVMLGSGIKELRERKVIDDRLYDWSQSLAAMRNLAAHPEDITVSRRDAEDLQAFVYAITEYVYDLTDRYNEFKEREEEMKKPRKSVAEMFGGLTFPKTES
jgi:Domain of unknown function (DUF4145)